MSKDVRLLPAVIGVGAILFALKASGVAFNATAAESPAAPSPPAATSLAGDPTAAINAAMPIPRPSQSVQTAPPSPSLPPELEGTGVTSAEMDVLSSLADRRSALDERERELALKANLLAAAEQRVNQKIAELKTLQSKIQQMLDQRETMEKTQIDSLVKAYSGMKPADAARIFTQLDDKVRLAVASRMKPDAIAGILAKMPPEAAQKLTVQLATRLKVMETPAPAPAVSASAAQTVASLTPPAPIPAAPASAATTLASTAPASNSPPVPSAQAAPATPIPAPAVQVPAAPQVQASIQPSVPTAATTPVIAPITAPLAAPAPVKPAPVHPTHAPSHAVPHRPAAIHAAAPAAHAPTPLQSQAQPQATPQHTASAQPSAVTATNAAAIIAAPATEPAPAPPVVPTPVAPAPVAPSSPSGPAATAGP